MASAHLAAPIPDALAVEFHSYQLDWWEAMGDGCVIEDGRITIPERPGLGLTLDLDVISNYLIDGVELFDPA